MEQDKLYGIIRSKNEQLERSALKEAERLIDCIAQEQEVVRSATRRIEKFRTELKTMGVDQIDPKEVLGE